MRLKAEKSQIVAELSLQRHQKQGQIGNSNRIQKMMALFHFH